LGSNWILPSSGGGISGDCRALAFPSNLSTVTPIFGDRWSLFGFPFVIIGGEPLGYLSDALLDGLLPLRFIVPSGFSFGLVWISLQFPIQNHCRLKFAWRPLLFASPDLTWFCVRKGRVSIYLTELSWKEVDGWHGCFDCGFAILFGWLLQKIIQDNGPDHPPESYINTVGGGGWERALRCSTIKQGDKGLEVP
jgi:hypothetical protein